MEYDKFMEKVLPTLVFQEYIILLQWKDSDNNVITSNELLETEEDGEYVWLYDWYEGQEDVLVLGYIAVSDVKVPHMFEGE